MVWFWDIAYLPQLSNILFIFIKQVLNESVFYIYFLNPFPIYLCTLRNGYVVDKIKHDCSCKLLEVCILAYHVYHCIRRAYTERVGAA